MKRFFLFIGNLAACIRDCAIFIRRGGGGAEKLGGGALHKIAAKIGGLKVKSVI